MSSCGRSCNKSCCRKPLEIVVASESCPGRPGRPGRDGTNGINGLPGQNGSNGVTGATGLPGTNGQPGQTGATGATGQTGATGATGPPGVGTPGATGQTGAPGATGATGTSTPVINAQYATIGAQPGTIAPGQPFTYSPVVGFNSVTLTNPAIIASTGTFAAFPASGTVFQLVNAGRYEVSYQAFIPTDAGIVLYQGPNLSAGQMNPQAYTMIGKQNAGQMSNTVIINATANSFVAVVAAVGNAAAIQPGPNSSTTNANSTTVSINFLG